MNPEIVRVLAERCRQTETFIERLENNDPSLKCASLGFHLISDENLSRITRSLKDNTFLEILELQYNVSHNCDYITQLAKSLKTNKKLRTLDLLYCGINNTKAEALLDMLQENMTIFYILLDGNNIDEELLDVIESRLKQNRERQPLVKSASKM